MKVKRRDIHHVYNKKVERRKWSLTIYKTKVLNKLINRQTDCDL